MKFSKFELVTEKCLRTLSRFLQMISLTRCVCDYKNLQINTDGQDWQQSGQIRSQYKKLIVS